MQAGPFRNAGETSFDWGSAGRPIVVRDYILAGHLNTGQHRPTSEMPFEWRFADGPTQDCMLARDILSKM